jgi:hypothetical protein
MSLLTAKQMASIQRMGEQSFKIDVVIQHKLPFEKDDSNPMGDSELTYKTTTTTVKGWLVPNSSRDFSMGVAQVLTEGDFRLRVPAGTDIEPQDRVTIDGKDYAVSESTTEQTWPEWITVRLRRIQG